VQSSRDFLKQVFENPKDFAFSTAQMHNEVRTRQFVGFETRMEWRLHQCDKL